MKKIRKYIMTMLLFLAAGSIVNTQTSRAASAEVELSADNEEITVGQSLYVYIMIKSDTPFGDFEANLTYNDDILEYQGNNSFITGSSGFLKISDVNVPDADTQRKYSLEFKTVGIGVCDIALMEPFMVYDYETEAGLPVSSNVLTVNVKAAVTASTNAYLSSLKINPASLSPEFNKNTFEYQANVSYDTEKLIINADREDEKSIVRISGNDSLKEGENKVIITVIAESGAVIEYTIHVFREFAPEDEEIPEEGIITPSTKHGFFEIVRADGELYAEYNGRYRLVEPGPEVQIPSGYVKTKIIVSDISINVYAPEDDLGYEFLLIYAENELGEAGFYTYDKVERTLQRMIPDTLVIGAADDEASADQNALKKEYRSNMMKAVFVITLLGILCALLIVVIIRTYMKSR